MGGSGATWDHPGRRELEDFLASNLPAERTQAVVRHLIPGCAVCSSVMAEINAAPEADAYDLRIERAIGSVRRSRKTHTDAERFEERLEVATDRLSSDLGTLEAREPGRHLEQMFDIAREIRRTDPKRSLFVSCLAVAVAEDLGEAADESAPMHDLRARAWAELGNARRIADDLDGADEAFRDAFEHFDRGARSPALYARLVDLVASLRRAQRRFDEAAQLLDVACEIHRSQGERHLHGRALVNKGVVLLHATRYESAAVVTLEGMKRIDPSDERLTFTALHNLISSLALLGRHRQARAQLAATRPLYAEHASPAEQVRARWLEGMIAAGLGEYLPAYWAYDEARAGFADLKLPYETALVSLDLAVLWLEHGQLDEIEPLLQEVLLTFSLLGIAREAAAAVLLLYEAARQKQITLELVRRTIERLRELQQAPARDASG